MHAATVCTQAVELISPSQLLTGDTDGQVALWRLDEAGDDKRRLVRFDGHSGAVAALQGDGDKVVSAARDGTVRVWDVEWGKSASGCRASRATSAACTSRRRDSSRTGRTTPLCALTSLQVHWTARSLSEWRGIRYKGL